MMDEERVRPALTDTTAIYWDAGLPQEEIVYLPDLMSQDKHTVDWNPVTQRFEGGYPF